MGLRLRSPITARHDAAPVLPSGMNTPRQDPTDTKISELNTIQGGRAIPYLSSSLPFCVRFNSDFGETALYAGCNTRYGPVAAATRAEFHPLVINHFSPHVNILLAASYPGSSMALTSSTRAPALQWQPPPIPRPSGRHHSLRRSRSRVSSSAKFTSLPLIALARSQWLARILTIQQRLQASGDRFGVGTE